MPFVSQRLFAIVPAAGESRRMGRPKLLLPLGGATVIGRVASVLKIPAIAEAVVVIRPNDDALSDAVRAAGITPLRPPTAPVDMRASVQFGLDFLRDKHTPQPGDGWILIPADHPLLSAALLRQLLARWQKGDCRILVPTHAGRRGHPTFLGWELAEEVTRIPEDQGLNWLIRQHGDEVVELPVTDPDVLRDLDTPADYAALIAELEGADEDTPRA